jgi:hypothetical protein
MSKDTQIESRLQKLEAHLKEENEILCSAVDSFRKLDTVAYKLGLLESTESYAMRVPWWPMVSILGTFSAGKSTFINSHLGYDLQRTGTQAVDDKFTVICFSNREGVNVLPGIALDADPRFPFYQISREIEEITASGNQRIDSYIQLKTCSSEVLRGRILIDSPGFDADSQRTSTLRITDHIIDLSDLVLVFFDARHPEPGAMHDTLEHLVTATIDRHDSNKFLYILNQMDVAAREDNPEEVVAAWQRSLAHAGLTAGRFYRIYNPKVAMPIDNPKVKERFESKRDADMGDILKRMNQVGIERAYRIVGVLEQTARDIENRYVPKLRDLIQQWKTRVFWAEGVVLLLLLILMGLAYGVGALTSDMIPENTTSVGIIAAIIVVAFELLHFKIAGWAAKRVIKKLHSEVPDENVRESLILAFGKNTSFFRTLFLPFISEPVGWGKSMRKSIFNIYNQANDFVQDLNDRFTNPSGKMETKIEKAKEESSASDSSTNA